MCYDTEPEPFPSHIYMRSDIILQS